MHKTRYLTLSAGHPLCPMEFTFMDQPTVARKYSGKNYIFAEHTQKVFPCHFPFPCLSSLSSFPSHYVFIIIIIATISILDRVLLCSPS